MRETKTTPIGSNANEAPTGLNISKQIHDIAQELFAIPGVTAADAVNRILRPHIGPFKAEPGFITDQDGNRTERFDSVIYLGGDAGGSTPIPADAVAAVIDVHENMDLQSFRVAYQRIGQAKSLKKGPVHSVNNIPKTNVTLGIIFARRSDLTLEALAEELEHLNAQTPSKQWPDMVVFASTGVVNYATHFPGQKSLFDFLPPAEGALANYTPPIYIVITIRPTGAYTFNKMAAFLIAHLCIFSPEEKLPDLSQILKGVPPYGVTLSGYQYNLKGDLLPVPREFYNDRYLPSLPMRIESQQGGLLATIRFLPWQDGGVIQLEGKLPLIGLLVFLAKKAMERGGAINLPNSPDTQISYVLPITQADFSELLMRIQKQSNMVVRSEPGRFIVQKIADEGTSSPFVGRLMMGMMKLRDLVFDEPAGRKRFDNTYDHALSALMSARTSMQQIIQIWTGHVRKVSSGEIIQQSGQTVHISESIDRELKREVENFINTSVRTLKQGMQNLMKELQADIGFLFKQQSTFDAGIVALKNSDPLLAEYLQQTRAWSEPLIEELRNKGLEHGMWKLPRIEYIPTNTGAHAEEPSILGQPMTKYVSETFDRLACFLEDVTAHCLQQQMPSGITITEVSLAERHAEAPERFSPTVTLGGQPKWQIKSHTSSFEET